MSVEQFDDAVASIDAYRQEVARG
jgi:hypothetical protein